MNRRNCTSIVAQGWRNWRRVLDDAATRRIRAMHGFAKLLQAGGLMSYRSDTGGSLKLAAEAHSPILKCAKLRDLPKEGPKPRFLIIHVKTAKAPGLTIPRLPLLRAAEVFQ